MLLAQPGVVKVEVTGMMSPARFLYTVLTSTIVMVDVVQVVDVARLEAVTLAEPASEVLDPVEFEVKTAT